MKERRPSGAAPRARAMDAGPPEVRRAIEGRLRDWFRAPEERVAPAVWEETALRIFRLQFEGNEPSETAVPKSLALLRRH